MAENYDMGNHQPLLESDYLSADDLGHPEEGYIALNTGSQEDYSTLDSGSRDADYLEPIDATTVQESTRETEVTPSEQDYIEPIVGQRMYTSVTSLMTQVDVKDNASVDSSAFVNF